MSRQPNRIAPHATLGGGRIDRSRPLGFRFDGKSYTGYAGDTLASALLANDVHLVGRSFKYHRPRGILGLGAEEPNALIQLARGNRSEPNLRATQIELFDGLDAASQNRWPCLKYDVGAVNSTLHRLFPAGFYYKTFMWPASMWLTYEEVIRNAAGLGKAPEGPDPDRYEHMHTHPDVLIVGAGPAGLAAYVACGRFSAPFDLSAMDCRCLQHACNELYARTLMLQKRKALTPPNLSEREGEVAWRAEVETGRDQDTHPWVTSIAGQLGGRPWVARVPVWAGAVLFDQRGAGRSTPRRCLERNTTRHLIEDMERIAAHLKKDATDIVVLGIGGSSLGAKAVAQLTPSWPSAWCCGPRPRHLSSRRAAHRSRRRAWRRSPPGSDRRLRSHDARPRPCRPQSRDRASSRR